MEKVLSPYNDMMGSLKAWTEDEAVKRREQHDVEHLAERGEYLDVKEEVKRGERKGKSSDGKRKENEHKSTTAKLCTKNGLAESYSNKRENKKIRSTHSCGPHTPAKVSSHHCPESQSATGDTTPTFPHLLHFTEEEIAAAPGIDAECFPEMGFTESLPDSYNSQISLKSSPCCSRQPEIEEQKGNQAAANFPKQVMARTRSLKSRQSPDRESRTHSVRPRTKAAEVNESRKGLLSYHTPDFSKVEPRVRFPKSGYTPPKSRLSLNKELLSPATPIVFKSPADIVKEVLLEATDGLSTPSACNRPPTSAPSSTVPQDFRCRQQATMLLEQLQEDYNRLLTKYAEAENTIDRLRLEAKVNLYSDLPKPRHSKHSGPSHDASKFMTLDFSQAQRADIKSTSHPNGHSSHQSFQGEKLDKILYNQADKFLQQLHTYQDILKREKPKPSEQMKGLSQLAEGLDSLERGYLLARDEHKRLQRQQQGTKISHFDPERELEGLIYQCGLQLDEVKEQMEEMQQEQPTCEALPSPPPRPTLSSAPSEGGEILTHPQTPPLPLPVDHGGLVEVEVSSASEESDGKEAEDEETHKSFYLKPLTGKHRNVEQDSAPIIDHYQSFKELPKMFDHILKEQSLCSTALRTNMPGNAGQEKHGQRTGNMEVHKSVPQRKVKSDHQDAPPLHTSKQETSRFGPASHKTPTQSIRLPAHPPNDCRRLAVGKSYSSSLSSLGEITVSERTNSKLRTGSRRVVSQDGIISPETDSGFVGSESSHLTPAAAQSPLHQGAPERSVAVHQEGRTEKPQAVSTSSASPSHSHMNMELRGTSHFIPDQLRKSRQGQRRRTLSCSPQHWASQTEQTRADSGTSGFGLESDSTHSVSEDGQSDQYARCTNSIHSSHPCSSPTVQHHHGDSLRGLGSSQVASRNDAIQSLQAEVTTLKERLESCLRNKRPLSSVRTAPSPQDKYSPCYTSTPHVRSGDGQNGDVKRKERRTDNEVEELRRTTRTRSASAHRQKTQPDILTGSKLEPSTLQPHPQVSRCTQTSAAETDNCSHTNAAHSSRTHHKCSRDSTHTSCQPAESPDRAVKSRFVAAPPALLQYMCPPPVLLYSPPIYMSPSSSTGTSSGVRGRGEVKERNRCSLSPDKQHILDSSLNRAIRAARHMKHTSRRMAHSLASGLEYQDLLTQSCYY
ncbi:microtubule organization protein AKNA isoform X2 [Anabas testudineus]|uniref:AKNA domain-containing protein n=1 Tax=Anabas testudineus TaxID=64144 RepID=A0A3Q1HCJ2_ANATE|nr:microtubule organization protein AKNA isoform X2 [Anabas testudineus]